MINLFSKWILLFWCKMQVYAHILIKLFGLIINVQLFIKLAKLMEHYERMVIQLERNTTTLQRIERSPNGLENELQELKEKVG
ncbi:hypothetical protein EGH10_12720 [Brevibacillus laterosporus]|uniref:Uncharacterized protein n=2 Tax=Brevibacillus laterosporus TaxID=1465 RepID=A0A075R7Y5_BRELA|nr:hypothetical protein BRLA_c030310 [Brevibacillus laterosporus LMG 15441]RJL06462.1 hypothetical protein DM460_21885 [Brevibacillus laterosporus]TPH10554.1 hypothetical protein EGH10_12720 [Brevibacillus laterosporus]